MGKIRGRDYISWLWQYTAPYAGRIGLLLLFGLLETFASLAMVQITKEIIDHATVGSGFGQYPFASSCKAGLCRYLSCRYDLH